MMAWAANCDQKSIYDLINLWMGFFTHVTTLRVQDSSVGNEMKGELLHVDANTYNPKLNVCTSNEQ